MFAFVVLAYLTIVTVVAGARWHLNSTSPAIITNDLPLEVFVTTTTTSDAAPQLDRPTSSWPPNRTNIPLSPSRNAMVTATCEHFSTLLVYYSLFHESIDFLTALTLTTDPHALSYSERDATLEQLKQLQRAIQSLEWRVQTARADAENAIAWLESRRDQGWTNAGW